MVGQKTPGIEIFLERHGVMRTVWGLIARGIDRQPARFFGIFELMFQLGLAYGLVAKEIDLVDMDLGAFVDKEGKDLGVLNHGIAHLGGTDLGVLITFLRIEFPDGL